MLGSDYVSEKSVSVCFFSKKGAATSLPLPKHTEAVENEHKNEKKPIDLSVQKNEANPLLHVGVAISNRQQSVSTDDASSCVTDPYPTFPSQREDDGWLELEVIANR